MAHGVGRRCHRCIGCSIPYADIKGIGACCLNNSCKYRALKRRAPSVCPFISADTYDHRVISTLFFDLLDDLCKESSPVIRISAKFVCSLICIRREKLCDQILMATMKLYAVKSGFLSAYGGIAECMYQFPAFLCCQFLRCHRFEEWRRRHLNRGRCFLASFCFTSSVMKLRADFTAILMYFFHHLS